MTAARIHPIAQNPSSNTTIRPRMRAGANSLTYVEATGSSAPSPKPARNRSTKSAPTDHASAESPVAMPNTSRVMAKTARRPMRSASNPPIVAPSAMPAKPIATMSEVCCGESVHCTASAAMTNDTRPTSIASSAQPSPELVRIRACLRVNGSRSRRSPRVPFVSVAPAARPSLRGRVVAVMRAGSFRRERSWRAGVLEAQI